jgi:hypothetical protein
VLADITDVFAGPFGVTPNEILHEQWNIFRSLSSGGTAIGTTFNL